MPLSSCVSKKMFAELKPGQSGPVMVSLMVLDNNNKSRLIERKFTVTKNMNESMSISDHSHGGFITAGGGVRKPVMLKNLLIGEALFPPIIKKYSLFKGEKALNIFEDKTTLRNLIDLFSDIKDLSPYKAYAQFGDECSERAVSAAQKKDKASGEAAATLLRIRGELESRLAQEQARLEDLRKTYSDNQSKIDAIEADLETIELVHSMQDAIKELNDVVALKRSQLDENYSTNLLDKLWILNGFEPVLEEYANKMSKFSENKQTLIRLERERVIRENAKREAEAKTIEDLKKEGLWFVCADMGGETMYNLDLKGPIGLVIGNEGDGVSRLVKEKCDFIASIPMKGDIDSLNASVAAGVLAYEIVRQRLQA